EPCDEPYYEQYNEIQKPTNITCLDEFENEESLSSTKTVITNSIVDKYKSEYASVSDQNMTCMTEESPNYSNINL
ncbi:15479_t:CDS:2, partial [Cetraspora pellucida]